MIIKFINKVSEELVNDQLKAYEILQKDDYFVSDIVDYNSFTQRKNQRIVKSTNYNIGKLLGNLFGKDNIPIIGKRRGLTDADVDYQQLNLDNQIKNMGEFYIQNIIDNNNSIIRAYANGYFWIKQKYYDLGSRNLGFYSELQTNLSNYFKSSIIDWLLDQKNTDIIINDLKEYPNIEDNKRPAEKYINIISKDLTTTTNGIIELYTLNRIYGIPIIVYNDLNELLYVLDDGIKYNKNKTNSKIQDKYRKKEYVKDSINIRYASFSGADIPLNIEVIFYK
jgi:hypothetical protein